MHQEMSYQQNKVHLMMMIKENKIIQGETIVPMKKMNN